MRIDALVANNEYLGNGIYRLSLIVPGIVELIRPGQFVMLRVDNRFDPFLARPFSIYKIKKNTLFILYKILGKGTKILSEIESGNKLVIWGPLGKGFCLENVSPILISGGIGCAPLFFLAHKFLEKGQRIRWIHGGKNFSDLAIFIEEFYINFKKDDEKGMELCKKGLSENIFFNFGSITTFFSTEDGSGGYKGTVIDLLEKILMDISNLENIALMVCGPTPMLKSLAEISLQKGIRCQVLLETQMACGIGVCCGCSVPLKDGSFLQVCKEGPVVDSKLINWDKLDLL